MLMVGLWIQNILKSVRLSDCQDLIELRKRKKQVIKDQQAKVLNPKEEL